MNSVSSSINQTIAAWLHGVLTGHGAHLILRVYAMCGAHALATQLRRHPLIAKHINIVKGLVTAPPSPLDNGKSLLIILVNGQKTINYQDLLTSSAPYPVIYYTCTRPETINRVTLFY